MVSILLSAATMVAFSFAAVAGVRSIRRAVRPLPIVLYGTVVAGLNALFRVYTVSNRILAFPDQPDWNTSIITNAALILQVGLATFAAIVLGYTLHRVKETHGG